MPSAAAVALLAEGVDRNTLAFSFLLLIGASPSSRRAWIEIERPSCKPVYHRSPSSRRAWIEITPRNPTCSAACVALLAEGVDRNEKLPIEVKNKWESPSSRRAWIEMSSLSCSAW